jgi:hypothetical protein
VATFYVAAGTTTFPTITTVDNDIVIIAEGNQTISAGLAQSSKDMNSLRVGRLFTGHIGGAAALNIDCSQGTAPRIEYGAGGGSFRYQPNADCDLLRQTGHGSLYLVGGGTVAALEIGSGYTSVNGAVAVTNLRTSGGKLRQEYSATANTTWFFDGGEIETHRGFTGIGVVSGGAQVLVRRETTSATVPAGGTTLYILDGHVDWRGGNVTVVLGRKGSIDLSQAQVNLALTISGTGSALAKSRLDSHYATITVTETAYVGAPALYSGGGVNDGG